MQVTIRLFALAKQLAGQSVLTLNLPEASTVASLRLQIARDYPELAPLVPNLMIAIDSEYASDQMTIVKGSEIALIPPVSGGACHDSQRIESP
ncbi:molybdopterin converting factor subunit 1 [Singulisphaera sp. Ch08]|uniref:Molybdopterin synthase sulfur carrier subunit n=1 Tax=Singulisphaera sp. Ch08 TaxID=3120278 RepID=A0AAU7CA73_9BACT